MATDKYFVWNDELAKEYGNFLLNERIKWFNAFKGDAKPVPEDILFKQFKASKTKEDSIVESDYQILVAETSSGTPSIIYNGSREDVIKSIVDCGYKITMVKRLLDGAIFSVGDQTNKGVIINLFVGDNTLIANIDEGGLYMKYRLRELNKKAPKPQPLFYCEGGEAVYKGERYWRVSPDCTSHTDYYATEKGNYPKDYTDYCFATKQQALGYIKNNKPQYSYKEIINCLLKEDSAGAGVAYFSMDKFDELVKSKL